ncbi:hypothetical protein CERSUDRAFT_101349 [Gelatoporia subvermispora B]|uniref:Uncharacterized protein n=1 Tax=Ceriporiopsis subvermispora (strain B) TaxID=914234 RepID=M2QX07_CERS8|nr:hypothetical protein CERSUDRAFT_101349 [Gelatoporia subvermispora B]
MSQLAGVWIYMDFDISGRQHLVLDRHVSFQIGTPASGFSLARLHLSVVLGFCIHQRARRTPYLRFAVPVAQAETRGVIAKPQDGSIPQRSS